MISRTIYNVIVWVRKCYGLMYKLPFFFIFFLLLPHLQGEAKSLCEQPQSDGDYGEIILSASHSCFLLVQD